MEAGRPPFSVTNAIKLARLREHGTAEAGPGRFELDHKIALALEPVGGVSAELALGERGAESGAVDRFNCGGAA